MAKMRLLRYAPWGLSVAGIAGLLWLYTLPRQVVDNAAEAAARAPHPSARLHALPMDVSLQLRLAAWKEALAAASPDSTWIWADSLAYVYLRYNRLDTALRYVSVMRSVAALQAQQRSALHLYRAYVLALDEQQAELGVAVREQVATFLAQKQADSLAYLDLRVKAAMTYMSTDMPMRGVRALQAMEQRAPRSAEVLLALARLSLQSGQGAKAEERLRKLIKFYPKHVEGMLSLGRYLMQQKEADAVHEGRELLLRAKDFAKDPALQQLIAEELKINIKN